VKIDSEHGRGHAPKRFRDRDGAGCGGVEEPPNCVEQERAGPAGRVEDPLSKRVVDYMGHDSFGQPVWGVVLAQAVADLRSVTDW